LKIVGHDIVQGGGRAMFTCVSHCSQQTPWQENTWGTFSKIRE